MNADGRWSNLPCADAFAASAIKVCNVERQQRGELLVFTHLPKAGGSSIGAALTSAFSTSASPLAPCHLLWNGRDRAKACGAMSNWITGPTGIRQAPLLPHGPLSSSGANASLSSAVPFQHCGFLWAQHVDFSIVERIRAASLPRARVRPVTFVRHPVSLFFSEFLYKKHCLWRQQGRAAPDRSSASSLARHIARLRSSPGLRTLLTRFLAGASWCSCPAETSTAAAAARSSSGSGGGGSSGSGGGSSSGGSSSSSHEIRELRRRARANAATYALIGSLERFNGSMSLLSRLLDKAFAPRRSISPMGRSTYGTGHHRELAASNALEDCGVRREALPAADLPTEAQRAEVTRLLAEDIALYEELDRALAERLRAADVWS